MDKGKKKEVQKFAEGLENHPEEPQPVRPKPKSETDSEEKADKDRENGKS